MANHIRTSFIDHDYFYNGIYSDSHASLRKIGIENLAFIDMDIEYILNSRDKYEIKFYKETWLENPRHICFTIFNEQLNDPLLELHVELDKKKIYWKRPFTIFSYPNIRVRLKITQDTSKRQWSASEQI